MTTTPDQEEQLQLLDALITEYIKKECSYINIQDECSDKSLEINKKWKEIQRNVESQIKGEPIDQAIITNNKFVHKTKEKLSQIINVSKILSDAYQTALRQFNILNRDFELLDDSREYVALQNYLRSLASDGKPQLEIFDKIQDAINGLEPIQELARPNFTDNAGQKQLWERIDQFVMELRKILDRGTGSLALGLETVG